MNCNWAIEIIRSVVLIDKMFSFVENLFHRRIFINWCINWPYWKLPYKSRITRKSSNTFHLYTHLYCRFQKKQILSNNQDFAISYFAYFSKLRICLFLCLFFVSLCVMSCEICFAFSWFLAFHKTEAKKNRLVQFSASLSSSQLKQYAEGVS